MTSTVIQHFASSWISLTRKIKKRCTQLLELTFRTLLLLCLLNFACMSEVPGMSRSSFLAKEFLESSRAQSPVSGIILRVGAGVSALDQFVRAVHASPNTIFLLDFETNHHFWSRAFQAKYGHRAFDGPDVLEQWFNLVHPDDKQRIRQSHLLARDGGLDTWEDEYRLRRSDGTYATVIDRASFLRRPDGSVGWSVSSLEDVSELRARENELRIARAEGPVFDDSRVLRGEQRLRAIVAVAANVIYEFDPTTGIIDYSEGMRATFGHNWLGKMMAGPVWAELLHPDERDEMTSEFQRFLDGKEQYERLEYRLKKADGTWANVRERMYALRNEDGKAFSVVGGMEDVTVELANEERLRQSSKLEAIGKLTGGVAHDFNNLLTVIIGNSNILENDPALPPEHKEIVRSVASAARRGAELVASLLAFARRQPLAPRPLNTKSIIEELSELLKRTLPADVKS